VRAQSLATGDMTQIASRNAPLVLKFGGELVQSPSQVAMVAAVVRDWSARGPLVLVHGGGKEIDKALRQSGIEERRAEGLRITDAATLDVVVAVLAGTVNTRIVAGLVAHGIAAVGLTGADGAIGLSVRAPAYEKSGGGRVDLELVGVPSAGADVSLLAHLLAGGYVPVVASIGVDNAGQLLNVNADVLAARLAAALGCRRLVIAGTTAGVLDDAGNTMAELDLAAIDRLIAQGTATDGMIAKLGACRTALSDGVAEVLLVDGRDPAALASLRGTRLRARVLGGHGGPPLR